MKNNNQAISKQNESSGDKIKMLVQLIDIKKDTNITRIYSAIKYSDFLNNKKTYK